MRNAEDVTEDRKATNEDERTEPIRSINCNSILFGPDISGVPKSEVGPWRAKPVLGVSKTLGAIKSFSFDTRRPRYPNSGPLDAKSLFESLVSQAHIFVG